MALASNDYGNEDSTTLVPGSLRVFRHFQLTREGKIAPMSWSMSDRYSVVTRYPENVYADVPADGVHHAQCDSYRPYRPHSAPDVACRCGFYAHYDPATDFYPSSYWGEDGYGATAYGTDFGAVITRGVAEVSGRVVMGRLGVRAEKIKIIALAVDWGKRLASSSRLWWTDEWIEESVLPRSRPGDFDDAEFKTEVNRRVAAAGARHGARFYDSVEKMYADHPPADISALGVDTNPPPPSDPAPGPHRNGGWYLHYNTSPLNVGRQASLYSNAVSTLPSSSASMKIFSEVFDEAVKEMETATKELSTFERALANKKVRPAPPGSGIDRRRGRLR